MAKDGKGVRLDGQLFLGAGAEPLSTSRLQVGQPGHQMFDRPSRISARLKQEGIDTTDGALMRQAEEETRSGLNVQGFARKMSDPGSEECLSNGLIWNSHWPS